MAEPIKCRLCKTCPFRPGNERKGWEPGARTELRQGLRRLDWFMECHGSPQSACAGFVAVLGPESIAVRLAVAMGRLKPIKLLPGMAGTFAEFDARARGAVGWT